ncbi:hypothetical protein [Herbiconiux solani]|uniref:hypothetical protein n=1 Tax=Herbiconiux solani TaxID=661329 RepID=UPI000824F632|nr:hypothetical protein [Herbiconiux solani]
MRDEWWRLFKKPSTAFWLGGAATLLGLCFLPFAASDPDLGFSMAAMFLVIAALLFLSGYASTVSDRMRDK